MHIPVTNLYRLQTDIAIARNVNHHNKSILLSQKSHHWLILSIQNMGRSNIHHRKTYPQEIFLSKDWIDAGYLPLQPGNECYISPNQAIATG